MSFADRIAENMAATVETPRRPGSMRRSIQGAAKVDTIGNAARESNNGVARNGGGQRWQERIWEYYDEVGELHYTTSFVGACLSRCVLTIGIRDEKGIVGPVFDENGEILKNEDGTERPELANAKEALALVRALKNEIGGQSELLRRMGQNLPAIGEFHLVGTKKDNDDRTDPPIEDLQWEVLSIDEFHPKGKDKYERKDGPGSQGREIDAKDVHVVRIWKSHPRWSKQADSSIKSVLDILEELVLLTREVRGETLSRLSNAGILLVPEEIEWGEDDLDEDSEAADSFTTDLIETFSTAIKDKDSAAGNVPFVVRAPADLLTPDKFRHIDLSSAARWDNSQAKRAEAVQRFAQGIDLPVEIVTGHADTTFANAVVIDDALFKAHIEPILDLIADALTVGYLIPGLDDTENQLVVWYDSGELVARPNRAQDAKDGHDRFVISDASLRASLGFSESDAPDEEEVARRIAILVAKAAKQQDNAKDEDDPGTDPEGEGDGPGGDDPGSEVEQGESAIGIRLSAMTEHAVERAVKRAGARLRSKAASNRSLQDQLAQVPDVEVAITLGPALVDRVMKGDDLFHGEFDTLWSLAVRWTGDQNFADRLKDACLEVARDRLYQPRMPFPFRSIPAWNEPKLPIYARP